ncbi:hypothetical protein BSKO_05611 [Bryopsis sp. KO-2023]|nr:hypothetical protein BSKO_05611 [Bryopsis sp. KO-2023]
MNRPPQRREFTGNGAPPQQQPAPFLYDWAVGCRIHLTTTLDEEISGTLFAFDKLTNCLTLEEPGDEPGYVNFRVLKATFIREVVSAKPPTRPPVTRLPYVDLSKAFARDRYYREYAEDFPYSGP